MQKAPKGLRTHIGLFGRMNVGKSCLLNTLAGQDVAITSAHPGTTTDTVEKPMELLPLGPVVIIDTAGLDDQSALGTARIKRTHAVLEHVNVVVLVVEAGMWGVWEEQVVGRARTRKCPLVICINKTDVQPPDDVFVESLRDITPYVISGSCCDDARKQFGHTLRETLVAAGMQCAPQEKTLLSDLVAPGACVVMIIPIDLEAPRGRLILPQVQAIRDTLDHDAMSLVVKEHQYADALARLATPPALVVCDSQVVAHMVEHTPADVPCTTFSILLARVKGDLAAAVQGAEQLKSLRNGDTVLIAESCSHHPLKDDIGREKIPRWLRARYGDDITIDVISGRDFPTDLTPYRVIIHCGACMLTREEMQNRIRAASAADVALTNYGVCIAALHDVLPRVLAPFPEYRMTEAYA